MIRRIGSFLLVFSLAAVSAWAVPKDEYTRLARLSYIEGNVSYQTATDNDWAAASVNVPLEPGDRIYAGNDGRAEIEFGDGSIYRLAHNTDIEILSLRVERIQVRVLVGLSTLIVASDTDFEINTPAAAFTAIRRGTYRFGVNENGDTDAIVRKGELEAANNQFSRRIQAGEMVQVAAGDAGTPQYSRYNERDEWDEWNDRRNADMNAYAGKRYLPDTVYIGASDLYRHGRWVNVDSYGLAWIPFGIGVSWAPYSTGRWCYRPFYGWTWVSYEPWGWLPYHYGRWYRSGIYGWCWLPGPAFAFNFWSPALVTFYHGPGWVSWCPLGPGDYYNVNHYYYNHRAYSHQLAHLRGLHTRLPGNNFYRGDRDAFRTADIDHFRNGSFGGQGREARVRNVDQPWKQGEMVRNRLPVEPTRSSFRADPDRRATGPERENRSLPTIVRNSPGGNLRGREQFRRITNPAIPTLPSRAERRVTEQAQVQARGDEAGRRTRVVETPQRERADARVASPQRTASPDTGARRTTTYRWTGTTETSRESARSGGGGVQTPRPANNAEQRNPSGPRAEGPVQEQRNAQAPSTRVTPRVEQNDRPNNYAERRSSVTERSNSGNSRPAEAPRTEGNRSYGTPQPEKAPSYSAPRVERTPYTAPRTQSAPSYSAPRNDREPSHAEPRQAASPVSGPRTDSPSAHNRSGEGAAPSSAGKSGGNSSSGSSSGGQAHGRNQK